ncbi:MAG: trypsin-like peptidase domain-containing protein [Pseudomonadota bacterium]
MRLIYLVIFACLWGIIPRTGAEAAGLDPAVANRVIGATLVLESADGRETFLGSGFVFGRGDRVVTNAHVVGARRSVVVVSSLGDKVRATVVAVDTARDLAVLELTTELSHVLQPAAGFLEVGQAVYAAGAPLEAAFTLTAGIVSNKSRQVVSTEPVEYIQHSAPVNPGSSGGPLVDASGRVIGVNARIADGSRYFVGIAYAVPVSDVSDVILSGPLPEFAAPGFHLRALSGQIAEALDHVGPGVLVEDVLPGSPASRAGLEAGDILIRAAGQGVADPGDMAFVLADAGVEVTLTVIRRGERLDLSLNRARSATMLALLQPEASARSRDTYALGDIGLTIAPGGEITAVAGNGAGYFLGLSAGDRIDAIDGIPVTEMAEGWHTNFTFERPVLLRIALAGGGRRHYVLDPWAPHDGLRLPSGSNMLDPEVVNFD